MDTKFNIGDMVVIDFEEVKKDDVVDRKWIRIMKRYFKNNEGIVIRIHNKGNENESYDLTLKKDLQKSVSERKEFKFFKHELNIKQ